MSQRRWWLLLMVLCIFAGPAFGQAVTIEWVDNSGQPISQAYEFSSVRLRATDAGSAGLGSLSVRVTSDLRGDEEWVTLWEDANNPGVFISSAYALSLPGTLATDPPAQDGWLEVTENPGPPLQRDTIRAFLESCSTPPCPTDAVPMIGSTIRLTDSERVDVDQAVPGSPLYIAVRDHGAPYWAPTTATVVTQGGDSETVSLPPDFSDPYIPINAFRQSIDVEIGPAVPGDGVLQVQDLDTITASHPDPLGLSSSTDSAVVDTRPIRFLDRFGTAVDALMVGGDIRVRAVYPAGNLNPAEADTVTIDVRSRQSTGSVRDTETLQLFETGPNTAVFTGTMPSRAHYFTVVGDGVLQVWRTNDQNDTVEAELGAITATATLIPGFIRIVDASGADVTGIPEGGTVYLRVEYEDGNDPMYQGYLQVRVLSVTTGDEQYVAMWETGPDTAVFTGSLPTVIAASPVPLNGQLETQSGETIRASLDHYFGSAVDLAVIEFVNDPPAAMDDTAYVAEDSAVMIDVLANDNDVDGDSLSITAVTQGSNGAVTFNASSVTYTPNANFNGSDSFTYSISDGNGGSATATVSIIVNAVNDSPVAANDSKTTAEDTATTISVLTNDSDLDGDTLSITAVTQGARGSVTFTGSSVTYTPAANANGSDSFTYTIGDGHGGSATATVSITITAVNDAPDAVNDSTATNEDAAVIISVLVNDADVDGEAVILTGVTQGTRGSVAQNGNGTVTYTPNPNTFGADAFTYTVRDAAGLTDTAAVNVNVAPVNDPPDAINDSATANEGSNVAIAVLANDTDLEGNTLTVTAASTPAHGAATINGNGTVTYTPVPTYSGSDSFTYTISDGAATDTATVSVQVKDTIGNVAVLGTHSVWIQSGADVLSGDVVANEAGSAPFLGSAEVSIGGGGASTAAGWDVQGNRVTVASGASVASDVYYNQLTNNGSIGGAQYTPLSLPVFAALPAFQSASPGSTDVNVAINGSQTLAPGSYRDLIVGRKATVTFTGGTYHFRSIQVDREARLFFSAASGIRVQQKLSTGVTVTIGPGSGSSATAASIVFYVGGTNGTSGTLAATPKAVEVGSDNVVSANIYAPNGTLWLKDHAQATGSFLGRDVNVGGNVQVSLMSAW